jgi:HD-GYP domain-containing protein (c-di-GMP phosphodiesterase class II)
MAQFTEIDLDPFVSVPAEKLVVGTSLPFAVFLKDRSIVIPLFNKGTIFDGIASNILRDKGIGTIYVRTSDGVELDNYLWQRREPKKTTPDRSKYDEYVASKSQHYLIERALLQPGTRITFSLYVLIQFHLSILLPATEQVPATIDDRVVNIPGDIVIKPEDIPRYNAYLSTLLSAGGTKEKDRDKIKRSALKENSKLILKDLLDNPRSGEKIRESITMVNTMVESILENRSAASDLLSLRTYDYYTYTHSVNVAVLSVGLGIAAGLKREDLVTLGIGAMLHDVGKSAIPASIINKAGRLDDDEYRIIKTHVSEGENILRINKEIPQNSFLAVSQHHERLSGRGYPNNKAGQEIHLFGRITSIVDCYDAMTTERSYQPARTPFYALSTITRESEDFDRELLKEFIRMLGELKA